MLYQSLSHFITSISLSIYFYLCLNRKQTGNEFYLITLSPTLQWRSNTISTVFWNVSHIISNSIKLRWPENYFYTAYLVLKRRACSTEELTNDSLCCLIYWPMWIDIEVWVNVIVWLIWLAKYRQTNCFVHLVVFWFPINKPLYNITCVRKYT